MIHTRICDLLGVRHPIVLGGMGTATTAPLVAAVSNAGAFGTLGTSAFNAATLESEIAAIHERTDKPFGINHLLFQVQEEMFAVTLRARPAVAAFAWARKDQDLRNYFQRAHDAGSKVMYMAGEVPEAVRAQFSTTMNTWRTEWKKLADNPQTRGTLASVCKTHLENARTQMKAYNCTF